MAGLSTDLHQILLRYRHELQLFIQQRVACADLAAELTQEALTRVLDSGEKLESRREIRARLFKAAAHLADAHNQSASQHAATGAVRPAPETAGGSAEQQALSAEELDILRRAIDELPHKTREVFILHKFELLSYDEVAERLAIPRNKVTVHMAKALSYCRHRLEEYRRG